MTVTLNGWPVAETQGGQVAGLINDSVVDGTNHLSIVVAAPPGGKPGPADTATVLIQNGDAAVLSFKLLFCLSSGKRAPLRFSRCRFTRR